MLMKTTLCALFAAAAPVLAQSGDCSKAFVAPQAAGAQISMTLRAGAVDIVGTKENVVRVTCQVGRPADAGSIHIYFAAGKLTVSGGPNKDVRYRIEVPEKSGLMVRAAAGDMTVKGITGNKDVELSAGDLTMEAGDPASYKLAEGKVSVGDLNAKPFGAQKAGFAGSFRKENSGGQYRLHVALMAGNLTLK
ncbi:MAG: hypothetical protein JWN34_4782 [Bryobacterales bacterium]|nr:hypothetical protein [Bryobacterales bacterium]